MDLGDHGKNPATCRLPSHGPGERSCIPGDDNMFEIVNDVYRPPTSSTILIVHGYQIRATEDQERRIRALTVEQRMELLLRMAVIRPSTEPDGASPSTGYGGTATGRWVIT